MITRLLVLLLPFLPFGLVAPGPIALDFTFPAGTSYRLSPLVVEGQHGVTIRGQRHLAGVSRLVYRGPPTVGAVQFVGCSRAKLIDLEIVIESAGVDAAVLVTNAVDPPSQGYSTANLISNVRVLDSGNGKAARYAFNVDSYSGGGRDGNNEQHRFDRCEAKSYTDAGFHIKGSQCHQVVFDHCAALDYGGRRSIGVYLEEGGHFTWRNGNTSYNAIDFKFGSFEQNSIISDNRSEGSTQFLVMGTGGGDAILSVSNVDWDCRPEAGKPAFEGRGPNTVSIRDSWFAGTNGLCPTIRFTGAGGSLDLSGVMLRQHGGTTPLGPLIACPLSWDVRQHGLRHQMIPPVGPRVTKKIVVNTLGVQ